MPDLFRCNGGTNDHPRMHASVVRGYSLLTQAPLHFLPAVGIVYSPTFPHVKIGENNQDVQPVPMDLLRSD